MCDYLHKVSHIIWLIMNRNRKACLAYVNNVCLRMLGCVHCARLCVSARLCAFLLGCVLCLARLVLVIDGRTVCHGVYHNNYLHQHDWDKTGDLMQDCNIAIVLAMAILESCTKSSRWSNERRILIIGVDEERRSLFPYWNGILGPLLFTSFIIKPLQYITVLNKFMTQENDLRHQCTVGLPVPLCI